MWLAWPSCHLGVVVDPIARGGFAREGEGRGEGLGFGMGVVQGKAGNSRFGSLGGTNDCITLKSPS